LCNVLSTTCICQQFVPHFALSSLIFVCGIASEQLALTAGFKAVLDDEGKSRDASLSNSDTLPWYLRLYSLTIHLKQNGHC